ncbi:hypothetical protein Rs2_16256 [Raphanus sativus]|nr:hypothetical protein Rs2_16256 [Raphanus sativus]
MATSFIILVDLKTGTSLSKEDVMLRAPQLCSVFAARVVGLFIIFRRLSLQPHYYWRPLGRLLLKTRTRLLRKPPMVYNLSHHFSFGSSKMIGPQQRLFSQVFLPVPRLLLPLFLEGDGRAVLCRNGEAI